MATGDNKEGGHGVDNGQSPPRRSVSLADILDEEELCAKPPPVPPATAAPPTDSTRPVMLSMTRPFIAATGKSIVLAHLDEEIMRLLVEKTRQAVRVGEPIRMHQWAQIAQTINVSMDMAFKNGRSIQSRVYWLVKVFNDNRHSEHATLTVPLREMVREFNEFSTARRRVKQVYLFDDDDVDEDEEEEEEELEEEEDAVDDSQQTEWSEGELSSSGGCADYAIRLGYRKPVVEAAADEKLLALLLEKSSRAQDRKKMWASLAAAFPSGKFKTSIVSVEQRVVWLLRVFNNPARPEHASLTPKLRKMLATCEKHALHRGESEQRRYKKKHKTTPTPVDNDCVDEEELSACDEDDSGLSSTGESDEEDEDASPRKQVRRRPLHSDEDSADEDSDADSSFSYQCGRQHTKVQVDAAGEETLMRRVLAKAPQLAARKKMAVWDEIARGHFDNGKSARGHVAWLWKVARDRSHAQYGNMTDALKKMLKKFADIDADATMCRRFAPQARAIKEEETKSQPQPEPRMRPPASSQAAKTAAPNTIWADADELLVRLALERRPFYASGGTKAKVDAWDAISREMCANGCAITQGAHAEKRFQFLAAAFRDPSHSQHHNLTKPLRKMLAACDRLQETHKAAKRPRDAEDSVQSRDSSKQLKCRATASQGTQMEALRRDMHKLAALFKTECETRRGETAMILMRFEREVEEVTEMVNSVKNALLLAAPKQAP